MRTLLDKETFMEKYKLKDTKYGERMTAMRKESGFEEGYIAPSRKEVWIDEEIYQNYLIYLSDQRKKEMFSQ